MKQKEMIRITRLTACVSLCVLIVLCVLWEGLLNAGGSWKTLKALPLLLPLMGILKGKRYTYQWTSMLVLIYVAEGATRIFDPAPARWFAVSEMLLAIVLFVSTVWYARLTAPSRQKPDVREQSS